MELPACALNLKLKLNEGVRALASYCLSVPPQVQDRFQVETKSPLVVALSRFAPSYLCWGCNPEHSLSMSLSQAADGLVAVAP